MSVCLLVMTDGRRDCIAQTIPSAMANLNGPISRVIIHDDSADPVYRAWLTEQFPEFEIIGETERLGFGGAIRNAWQNVLPGDERWVFHLEDDFTFNRMVPIEDMITVLGDHPHLVQLVLRRQPWNDEERAAGGIVEQHPSDYIEVTDGPHVWLQHRRFFSTNPSLYRSALCRQPWPRGPHSEGHFTHQLLASPKIRFGFWGARDSGEWVTHVGTERVGNGY